jgi:hypothetical protein
MEAHDARGLSGPRRPRQPRRRRIVLPRQARLLGDPLDAHGFLGQQGANVVVLPLVGGRGRSAPLHLSHERGRFFSAICRSQSTKESLRVSQKI